MDFAFFTGICTKHDHKKERGFSRCAGPQRQGPPPMVAEPPDRAMTVLRATPLPSPA